MKKLKLKNWVRVVLSLILIHIGFFIWKQTGRIGELAQESCLYLGICMLTWFYLLVGQIFIYKKIWK